MGALTLRDIVDVEVLQEVQDRFADATGFAVIIGDEQGNPITRPSNFTSFCSYIRSCPEGLRRCILSDERVGILVAKKGRPVIHRCHSGLVDLAAPIIHNEKYLGAVLCGQVLMAGHEEEQLQNVYQNISELPEGKAMMVRVLGRYEEDKILFEVEDNGKGMPDIRLEDMLSTIQRHAVGHTTGIGIYNIHRRLQCQFGEQCGFPDSNYFSRIFRKREGIAPTEYRKWQRTITVLPPYQFQNSLF
ncbi:PocR ligand-binding domain-containing protein [Aneurinibacillus thermoaerophilus]|nr:PocR ligand-binding domain-containing protein [Aneurinibacillus thermoaerophilus]